MKLLVGKLRGKEMKGLNNDIVETHEKCEALNGGVLYHSFHIGTHVPTSKRPIKIKKEILVGGILIILCCMV